MRGHILFGGEDNAMNQKSSDGTATPTGKKIGHDSMVLVKCGSQKQGVLCPGRGVAFEGNW